MLFQASQPRKTSRRVSVKNLGGKTGRSWAFIGVSLLGSASVMAVWYWIFLSGAFAVRQIDIEGAERTDPALLRARITQALQTRRLFLIPQAQSIFIVNNTYIESQIKDAFSLTQASLRSVLPHRLVLRIEERNPAYILHTQSSDAIIDRQGVVISVLHEDTRENYALLWSLSAPSLNNAATSTHALQEPLMQFINELSAGFEAAPQGYRITELDISRALVHDITAHTTEPWIILMSDTQDALTQLQNVTRALHEIKQQKEKNIHYIDVRVPTKIFYK